MRLKHSRGAVVQHTRTSGSAFPAARRDTNEVMNSLRSAFALRVHSALNPPNPVSSSSVSTT
jgi:hypothetical protein